MNTKVTRKQVEEARNYLYNINTQLGMTLYDPELAEIIKNREVVEIQGKRYHIESSPLGTCDGCCFMGKAMPTESCNILYFKWRKYYSRSRTK